MIIDKENVSLEQYIISKEKCAVVDTGILHNSACFFWAGNKNILQFEDKKILVYDKRIYLLDNAKPIEKTLSEHEYSYLVPIFEGGSFNLDKNRYNNIDECEVIISAMENGEIPKDEGVLNAYKPAEPTILRRLCALQKEYLELKDI